MVSEQLKLEQHNSWGTNHREKSARGHQGCRQKCLGNFILKFLPSALPQLFCAVKASPYRNCWAASLVPHDFFISAILTKEHLMQDAWQGQLSFLSEERLTRIYGDGHVTVQPACHAAAVFALHFTKTMLSIFNIPTSFYSTLHI